MDDQSRELIQTWAWRLCWGTALLVVLLSWFNGLSLQALVVRAGISFGAMYFLTVGLLSLFAKTAPRSPQAVRPTDSGRGGFIDVSLGGDELPGPQEQEQEPRFPGQVSEDINSKLLDSEQQAKMVRRMGWD